MLSLFIGLGFGLSDESSMHGGTEQGGVYVNGMWKLYKNKHTNFEWCHVTFDAKSATPSPRRRHTGWEHESKMYIFGGLGCSPVGYLDHFAEYWGYDSPWWDTARGRQRYFNNQLVCYDPTINTWTEIQCTGAIPTPRESQGTAKIYNQVWLFGGHFDNKGLNDMYVLDLGNFQWTQINTEGSLIPLHRCLHTLTALSEDQLIVHGGYSHSNGDLGDTWVFRPSTRKWEQYEGKPSKCTRYLHTAFKANNSIIVAGGMTKVIPPDSINYSCLYDIFKITQSHYQPKTLETLALQTVHVHRDELRPKKWSMPASIRSRFMEMLV